MAAIDQVCRECETKIKAVFDANTGTRDVVIISGAMHTQECCFVADEIIFLNGGQLIFDPSRKDGHDKTGYCQQYAVVCRKLTVKGGHKPVDITPCKPRDPGSQYDNNNVITWRDRLKSASPGGPVLPSSATKGADGLGNNGQNGNPGGTGQNGASGNSGGNGFDAPSFVLVTLEVVIGGLDVLVIDFDGQDGGAGSAGQNGGKGGKGSKGKKGESDTSWPGTGCDTEHGIGGDGGKGGDGGFGGTGGNGGRSGNITLVSTTPNVAVSGPFLSGSFFYVYDGGAVGPGGDGGVGGLGGAGGAAGSQLGGEDLCNPQPDGNDGDAGEPPPGQGASAIRQGSPGGHGGPGALKLEALPGSGSCADQLPAPVQITSTLTPDHYCRGFSTPESADGTLLGVNLGQISSVSVSLANITSTVKASSTDTQLDLKFDIAGNSGTGSADLILHRDFGPDVTVNNAATIARFEVLGTAPTNGARGTQVAVMISGNCFDAGAANQQVNLSGTGVDVLNVLVVDEHTVTCVFEIKGFAAQTARDVTVKTGTRQHTRLATFTIT
jgi:hypothetical protein